MKFYFLIILFLIFSCDFPNEADADCNGINMGLASIDVCGVCSSGLTGLEPNEYLENEFINLEDKFVIGPNADCLGNCFGGNNDPNIGICDCKGIPDGLNILDNCGVCDSDFSNDCVTDCNGFYEGEDGYTGAVVDNCGVCQGDGSSCLIGICTDEEALNYHSFIPQGYDPDDSLCVYDICETLPSNDEYLCNDSQINYPYQPGDEIRCNDLEMGLDICFPSDCNNNISLGDYYGKVIWLEMTSSWWSNCVTHLPGADGLIADYIDNPNFAAISVLMDTGQPHTCEAWGNFGNNKLPILINGGSSLTFGNQNGLESMFFTNSQIPKRVFIDHELKVYDIDVGYMSEEEIKFNIDQMLELMGN